MHDEHLVGSRHQTCAFLPSSNFAVQIIIIQLAIYRQNIILRYNISYSTIITNDVHNDNSNLSANVLIITALYSYRKNKKINDT